MRITLLALLCVVGCRSNPVAYRAPTPSIATLQTGPHAARVPATVTAIEPGTMWSKLDLPVGDGEIVATRDLLRVSWPAGDRDDRLAQFTSALQNHGAKKTAEIAGGDQPVQVWSVDGHEVMFSIADGDDGITRVVLQDLTTGG